MARSSFLQSFRALFAIALASGLPVVACDGDDSTGGSSGPAGPAHVRIAALLPAAGERVDPPRDGTGCVDYGRDASRTIDVLLRHDANFTLASPGECGGAEQCGFVLLTVEVVEGETAPGAPTVLTFPTVGETVSVPMSRFGDAVDRTVRFHVELWNDQGKPEKPEDGGVYTDEVVIAVKASCSGALPPDASAPDATDGSDAGPDADAASDADTGSPDADAASDATPDGTAPDVTVPDAADGAATDGSDGAPTDAGADG